MPTVAQFLSEWLQNTAKLHCKDSTHQEYKRAVLEQLIPAFGPKRLDALARADIARQVAVWAEQRKSRSTIRNYLAPLKAAYFEAMDDGLVSANPVSRANRLFRGVAGKGHKVNPFTREEVQTLLEKAKESHAVLFPLLLCAVRTGLRLGELIGAQWGAVDFNGRFLEVRRSVVRGLVTTPKNHRIRRVDLSPQLVQELKRLKEIRQLSAGTVAEA